MPAPPPLATALARRYRLGGELGQGGMASVYLGTDLRYERPVAIKVLRPELAASFGVERFLREVRIAAVLAHPHILPLLDAGEAGGFLYYVTPHVTGGTLRQRLAGGRLSVAETLRVVREVGAALDYAHRQGFVHRDVKPENILFADDHAVLADFGIARAANMLDTDSVTARGIALGTPEYMSPEQAAGDQELGSASDLYSLACVAYELLTSEPPLRGANARATMAKQVTEPAPPLRMRRPEVPAVLERALARALAKDPDHRYPSVAEFVAALEGDGVEPAVTVAAAPGIAVVPFTNASAESDSDYLSDGITDELIDALARVEGLRVAPRSAVFQPGRAPEDLGELGARLGVAWVLEGTVRRAGPRLRVTARLTGTGDGRLVWSERFDRQLEDVFAIQEEIARTIVETLRRVAFAKLAPPVQPRRTSDVEAYGLYLKGRFAWNQRTKEATAQATQYFEAALALDPGYAQAWAGLSDAYALALDYRDIPAEEGFRRAREAAERALALDETVAEAHTSLAWVLFVYDWDWEGSRREFQRAITLDPGYATAHQWYAFLLAALGQLDEGVAEVIKAVELDPGSVSVRRSAGWAHFYARRYDQARWHLARALEMNPTSDETCRLLGLSHVMQDRWEEAERVLREAVALSNGGRYNRATLAYLHGRTGRAGEAMAVLEEFKALRDSGDYVSPVALATIHLGLGDREAALDWTERALAERRGWLAYLGVNPILDPLRGHPRFEALRREMGV